MSRGRHQSTIEVLGVYARAAQARIDWLSRAEALVNLQSEGIETTIEVVTRQAQYLTDTGLLEKRHSPNRTGSRGPTGYQYRITGRGMALYNELMSRSAGRRRWQQLCEMESSRQ